MVLTAGELLLDVAERTVAVEGIETAADEDATAELDGADGLGCAGEGGIDEGAELDGGPCSSVMVLVSVLCNVMRLVVVVCRILGVLGAGAELILAETGGTNDVDVGKVGSKLAGALDVNMLETKELVRVTGHTVVETAIVEVTTVVAF